MSLGRMLIIAGGVLILLGVLLTAGAKLPFKPGQLPGDFIIRGKHSLFYFPLTTGILISILLSGILWLIGRKG